MSQESLVGIIIVTWNKEQFVLELLESLSDLNYKNHEINVIDNASEDDTVNKIKTRFPDVNLIENKKNLGGTGGFNTGMRFALTNKHYDYLWLLDNDAYVEPDTLTGLIDTIKSDRSIGVAGSLICHPENKQTVVELGGRVNWNSGIWNTCHRNEHRAQLKEAVKDVDYVAACSMLIKTSVLKKAGIFDEKMFVHWDDVEFCLRVKRNGFRVVATTQSVIYHDSEKKVPLVFLYYDLRNALLTMNYHLTGIKKHICFLFHLRRLMKRIVLAKLFKENNLHQIPQSALDDFLCHNFYKFNDTVNHEPPPEKSADIRSHKNFLIMPHGTVFDLIECASHIKATSPGSNVTVMIQEERVNLIKDHACFDRIITLDNYGSKTINILQQLTRLFFSTYDTCVLSIDQDILSIHTLPFKKSICFNNKNKTFYVSKYNRSGLWKIAYAFIMGEILALYTLPKVMNSSRLLQNDLPDHKVFK